MIKRVLIVEDKRPTRDEMKALVEEVDSEALVYVAENEEQGYAIAMKYSIDMFLIDVVLHPGRLGRDQTGAVFAYTMRGVLKYRFTPMIFVTKLYDPDFTLINTVRCFSILEKPYDPDKFKGIIREGLKYHTQDPRDVPYFYQKDGMLEAVSLREIIYIDSIRGKLYLHTQDKTIMIANKPGKTLMEELDPREFLVCRRGTMVNVNYIWKIDPVNRYICLKGTKTMLEIGPTVRKEFLNTIKSMLTVVN